MSGLSVAFTEYFVVLVRTAACVMVLPGFSMSQIAMQIRLYTAIALSICIYFLVYDSINLQNNLSVPQLAHIIFSEVLLAFMIAIPIRILHLSLSFLGEVIMQMIGLNPIPGTPIGDTQATTVLSSLFNMTAIVLFFSSGLFMGFVGGLAQSFVTFPPGAVIGVDAFVETLSEDVSEFFRIVLRLMAPLLIFSIVMNVIAGMVNKLTPQIPVYFVSTPFLICGGVMILTWVGDDMMLIFHVEMQNFIGRLF